MASPSAHIHPYTLYAKQLCGLEESCAYQLQLNFSKEADIPSVQDAGLFINRQKEKLKLSVSLLNNLLDCGYKFYYENLVCIGAGRTPATVFGSAIHYALEMAYKRMRLNPKKTFPDLNYVLTVFENYMNQQKGIFFQPTYDEKIENGHEILKHYYEPHKEQWPNHSIVEKYLTANIDGINISGKIDRIDFVGNAAYVIDYKTGKSTKKTSMLYPPNELEPNGGHYWRQSVFYKLLIDLQTNDWETKKVSYHFLESKPSFEVIDIPLDAGSTTTVKQQIKKAAASIKNNNYRTPCGHEACPYCLLSQKDKVLERLNESSFFG